VQSKKKRSISEKKGDEEQEFHLSTFLVRRGERGGKRKGYYPLGDFLDSPPQMRHRKRGRGIRGFSCFLMFTGKKGVTAAFP